MARTDTEHRSLRTNAIGVGLATGAYGLSFGAIAIASGLDGWQVQAMSLLMFTGASQFALVGVLGAGGGVVAAVLAAWFLGARNGLYALHMAPVLRPLGWRTPLAAHFTIDESTGMSIAQGDDLPRARYAFWATGLSVFVLWNLGTLLGTLGAALLSDPAVLGLDAAIPAAFLALLWPRLRGRTAWSVAVAAAVLALALVPWTAPGVPVLTSALIAVVVGLRATGRP